MELKVRGREGWYGGEGNVRTGHQAQGEGCREKEVSGEREGRLVWQGGSRRAGDGA